MPTIAELFELFWALVAPWIFMSQTLHYLPSTIWRLLKAGEVTSIASWSRFQTAWFSLFWAWMGPRIREGRGPRITALFEGRVTNARIVDEPVIPPLSGVVLDIGPGHGYWIDLYAKAQESGTEARIEKVFGVEPSTAAHVHLSKRIREVGLEEVYDILPVGIESLSLANVKGSHYKNQTIEKGSVDCVVSLLCLCSIPEPEKNIRELYEYLKPGGRWYLYEHVRVRGPWPMRLHQGTLY